ncbi:major facilitator superfamily transporter [Talaromyces proteolyticus]|uniref:Major facilitator superfamily transporter n=1 Tax=Talaromyces proteolyticus TaxID=1131652 RepID=A0AAD4Q442_9EURO|nr:major facilitator superfamily transporter [Talaromyces proteolyticus]KAH8702307.1 major facilitator superfamily transporter [Talaromyces proteolyticus]
MSAQGTDKQIHDNVADNPHAGRESIPGIDHDDHILDVISSEQHSKHATTAPNTLDPEKGVASSDSSEPRGKEAKNQNSEAVFSTFKVAEKRLIVLIVALTTLLPPLTGSMYYPVIPMLAEELHVSISDINLTITAYLIVQGIAPSFTGNLSDETGRRPALVVTFIIYIAGCVGAAVKGNYALLFVMRCLQSAGSSGTIALSLATVSDIVTSAERGSYTSYVQMGWMVGPALGPVIGGLLSHYLGWRSIFWFLTIFSSVVFVVLLVFLPETSRNIVGNGSIPPPKWNMSLLVYLRSRKQQQVCSTTRSASVDRQAPMALRAQLNPFSSLKIFLDKEVCILLLYSGLIYASSYMVLSTMPDQLQEHYGFNTLQISLCYLATGVGTMTSVLFTGRLLDWNFRRHAKQLGMEISKDKQQDLTDFPIEVARLQVGIHVLVLAGISLVAYGWTMQTETSLAAPMIFLFLQSFGNASAFSGFNNLIMDLNRTKPGAASAAMNLARCWMGAGGVAFAGPLNKAGGVGWMAVMIAGMWLVFSPFVFMVLRYGPKWRGAKREEMDTSAA